MQPEQDLVLEYVWVPLVVLGHAEMLAGVGEGQVGVTQTPPVKI